MRAALRRTSAMPGTTATSIESYAAFTGSESNMRSLLAGGTWASSSAHLADARRQVTRLMVAIAGTSSGQASPSSTATVMLSPFELASSSEQHFVFDDQPRLSVLRSSGIAEHIERAAAQETQFSARGDLEQALSATGDEAHLLSLCRCGGFRDRRSQAGGRRPRWKLKAVSFLAHRPLELAPQCGSPTKRRV